jgi:hypothetical protein
MVMAEQVQPRLHRRENLVDLRLAGVRSTAARKRPERLGGFVREQDVDHADERRETLHFLTHEVPSLVCEPGRLRTALPGMRQIGGRRFIPSGREGSAEAGNLNDRLTLVNDLDERPVVDVDEILGQIA